MSVEELARLIVLDALIVAVWTIAVGATAPRWPARWLHSDTGPLRLRSFDAPTTYTRLRVRRWGSRLPEAGAAFGGSSKRALPGRDPRDLKAYLVEVRRAEWVHWLSMLSIVPILAIGPWWLALAFSAVILLVNLTFVIILRHNRVRLLALLRRSERVA